MFKKHFTKLIVMVLLLSMVLAMAVSCIKDPPPEPKPEKPHVPTTLEKLGDMFGKIAGGYNVDPSKEFSLDFAVDFKATEDKKTVSDLQFVAKGNFDFTGEKNANNNLLLEVKDKHELANNKTPFGVFFEGTADSGNIIVSVKNEDGVSSLVKLNAFSIKHLFNSTDIEKKSVPKKDKDGNIEPGKFEEGIIPEGSKIGTDGSRVALSDTIGMVIDLLAEVTYSNEDYTISITKSKILALLDLVGTMAGSNEALDSLIATLLKADIKVSPIIESLLSVLDIDVIDKDGKPVFDKDGVTPLKVTTLGLLADWVKIKFPTDFVIDIVADFDGVKFLGLKVNLDYNPNALMAADEEAKGNKTFGLEVAMTKFAIVQEGMTAADMIKDTFLAETDIEAIAAQNMLNATISGNAVVEKKDSTENYTWDLDMDINPFVLIYGNKSEHFENFGTLSFVINNNSSQIFKLNYDSAVSPDDITLVIKDGGAQIIDIQVLKKMFDDKKSAKEIIEYIIPSLIDMPALPELTDDQVKEFDKIANIMGIVMGAVPVIFDAIQSVSYDKDTYFANINIAKLFDSLTKAVDAIKVVFNGKDAVAEVPAVGETPAVPAIPAVPGAIVGKEVEITAIIDYIYKELIKPLEEVTSFKISVTNTTIWGITV